MSLQKKILFQNHYFVAVDKPALWLTTPSRQGDADLRPCLGTRLQHVLQQQIFPVHRLDFEVSGLTLFALTAEAHRLSNGWFEKRQVKKTYEALTTGPVLQPQQTFIWENKLVRGKKRSFVAPHGQWAKTEAIHLTTYSNGRQYWRLTPWTGRSHQLRVHLALSGHPICGDTLYGAQEIFQDGAIALRSLELDFSECPNRTEFQLPDKILTDTALTDSSF